MLGLQGDEDNMLGLEEDEDNMLNAIKIMEDRTRRQSTMRSNRRSFSIKVDSFAET